MSTQLNFIINESKCGIMRLFKRASKNNGKNGKHEHHDGIPFVNQYKYLGITISGNGNIKSHINHLNSTCSYIANHVKWITKDHSIKTKCFLWKCFVRPHLLYTFSILDLMAKTTHIDRVLGIWRSTFKNVVGFPRNTPDDIILRFTDSPTDWMNYFASATDIKCKLRHENYDQQIYVQAEKPDKMDKEILKAMPSNFPKIYSLASHFCPIHQNIRLGHQHFCKHMGKKYNAMIEDLFANRPQQLNHEDMNRHMKEVHDKLSQEIKMRKKEQLKT